MLQIKDNIKLRVCEAFRWRFGCFFKAKTIFEWSDDRTAVSTNEPQPQLITLIEGCDRGIKSVKGQSRSVLAAKIRHLPWPPKYRPIVLPLIVST